MSAASSGAVIVTWSYIHTGGLPLTNVSVSYANDNSLSPIPIPLISVDTTSVTIPDLKAGFEYTFNVTAENSEGSSSTVCGPITPKSGDSLFKITGSWAQFILCALIYGLQLNCKHTIHTHTHGIILLYMYTHFYTHNNIMYTLTTGYY